VIAGNAAKLDGFIGSGYTEVIDGRRYPVGWEGACGDILGVRTMYPDLTIAIDEQIAEGEWVVTGITTHGTHLGDGWG
jgi:hypothetical protein